MAKKKQAVKEKKIIRVIIGSVHDKENVEEEVYTLSDAVDLLSCHWDSKGDRYNIQVEYVGQQGEQHIQKSMKGKADVLLPDLADQEEWNVYSFLAVPGNQYGEWVEGFYIRLINEEGSMAKAKKSGSVLQKLDKETVEGMKETMEKTKAKRPTPKGKVESPKAAYIKQEKKAAKSKPSSEVTTTVYQGKEALTVEQAKELIGWRVVEYKTSGKGNEKPEQTLMKYHMKDRGGNKVWLGNNATNRPIRPGMVMRYMSEILRKKWALNGTTIVFDDQGMCTDGQHRLIAFILAEEERKKDPKKYAERYGWGGTGTATELKLECIVVRGVSSEQEVKDTHNQGQKQTGGDAIFQRDYFAGENDTKRRKLANILAGAARLAWLRSTDKKVSDAPHFPISEMIDFIEDNIKLVDYTQYIYKLETTTKSGGITKGSKQGGGISMAYAAGLCYLMATSETDYAKWKKEGPSALKFGMEKQALLFWDKFASPTNMGEGNPVYQLLQLLNSVDAGSASGRDEIMGMVIKSFNAFSDGKEVKPNQISIRRITTADGDVVLGEDPRLGGLDVEGRAALKLDTNSAADVQKVEETREGSKAGKQWAEGDEAWVVMSDGEHWFGQVQEVYKREDGTKGVIMLDLDAGKEWDEDLANLRLEYPGNNS